MPSELELLKAIAENTAQRPDDLRIAVVAGSAAILGALVSALAGYLGMARSAKVEREKLHATVVTTERLRWLQDLRSKVSTFYADAETLIAYFQRPLSSSEAGSLHERRELSLAQVSAQCYSIIPMLDTEKPDQASLYDALNASLQFLKDRLAEKTAAPLLMDDKLFISMKAQAFSALAAIGRKAWRKVQGLQ